MEQQKNEVAVPGFVIRIEGKYIPSSNGILARSEINPSSTVQESFKKEFIAHNNLPANGGSPHTLKDENSGPNR